jgi:hypothetical protein
MRNAGFEIQLQRRQSLLKRDQAGLQMRLKNRAEISYALKN